MAIIRRLVFAAACAGLLTGLFVAVLHQLGTVPLITRAEVFERAAEAGHGHAHAAQPAGEQAAHEHPSGAVEPPGGVKRFASTMVADVIAAIAYALLLTAGFALRGREVTWRGGLWWGLAGFAAFTLAPGLGLPPEVPGAQVAPLLSRQVWWATTAALTGGGLALLAYGERWMWSVLAVLAIVAPHVWGAPQPLEAGGAAPEALARQFVMAVTVVSFLSWAALGCSAAYFYRRFNAV